METKSFPRNSLKKAALWVDIHPLFHTAVPMGCSRLCDSPSLPLPGLNWSTTTAVTDDDRSLKSHEE